ncbi:methyltransferase family protein [Candidatus Omnitrophota bacterium]
MKEKNGEHPFGDAGQILFFCLFFVIWGGDSFFLHFSTVLSCSVPMAMRLGVMALSLIVSSYLFKSGHVVISHEQRPDYVVSLGAFRYIRHPLYLSVIIFYFGLIFSTFSLISSALLILIIAFYNFIASYEEKLLEERFREDYMQYKRRTGKWIPKLSKVHQQET